MDQVHHLRFEHRRIHDRISTDRNGTQTRIANLEHQVTQLGRWGAATFLIALFAVLAPIVKHSLMAFFSVTFMPKDKIKVGTGGSSDSEDIGSLDHDDSEADWQDASSLPRSASPYLLGLPMTPSASTELKRSGNLGSNHDLRVTSSSTFQKRCVFFIFEDVLCHAHFTLQPIACSQRP
jgi:hypothetical protein